MPWCLDGNKYQTCSCSENLKAHKISDLNNRVDSGFCQSQEVLLSKVETQTSALELAHVMHQIDHDGDSETYVQLNDATFASKEGVSLTNENTCRSVGKSIDAWKKENERLKHENEQMKDIYINHMRVCNSTGKKQSLASIALDQEIEPKYELAEKEQRVQDLENKLAQEQSRCLKLQEELKSYQSEFFVASLESIENAVKSLLDQNHDSKDNETLTAVINQFNTDITENFLHVQDFIQSAHIMTREKIFAHIERCSNQKISRTPTREVKVENGSSRESKHKQKRNFIYLENLKSRFKFFNVHAKSNALWFESSCFYISDSLSSIQQSIHGYECQVNEIEEERDRLHEELVKLVDVLQNKDEEIV